MPAPAPLDSFRDAAIRSRIMDRDTWMRLYASADLRAKGTAALYAEFLQAHGALTPFQAGKLLAGQWQGLVLGRYTILYPIGRGGMGIVYLARRSSPARTDPALVALKVLAPQRAKGEPRMLARFQREMEFGARLPIHPAIVCTLDSGEADGVHFLALEYVAGSTLKHLVLERGPLDVPAAARLFAEVARGLHRVHEGGTVHRDVKPANIVVTPTGRPKLLDFGFAVRRGEKPLADPTILGGQGYTMGTMDYLPPEQATDAVGVSAETDIYSLGCSLYFALSGAPPFPYGTAREKIRQHRNNAATVLNEVNPAIPAGLSKLVQWMMAKRPEDRPSSCEMVANELERIAGPAPVVATRASYDEAWEREVLERVAATWQARQSSHSESASAEVVSLDEEADSAERKPELVSPSKPLRNWWWTAAVLAFCCSGVAVGIAGIAYSWLHR